MLVRIGTEGTRPHGFQPWSHKVDQPSHIVIGKFAIADGLPKPFGIWPKQGCRTVPRRKVKAVPYLFDAGMKVGLACSLAVEVVKERGRVLAHHAVDPLQCLRCP